MDDELKKNFVALDCQVCGAPYEGPEPQTCCSGRECGCLGLPTEPMVCSEECYDKLIADVHNPDRTQATFTPGVDDKE